MSKDSILDKLNKVYGKNAVQKVRLIGKESVKRDSTGSLFIDRVTGGGFPQGGVIEIYGPESSGKTALTLQAIAQKQKTDKRDVAFIDMEHALDLEWAETLGVNVDELILSQPENGEQALEIVYNLICSGEFGMIVIDSVSALRPKKEIEGEMGDVNPGLHARLMGQACPKISISAKKNNCTVIFINQLREKIGVVFGNPETTTGGNALKFYASMRLDIRSSKQVLSSNDEKIGNLVKVKCVKNKVSVPFGKCETRFTYGIGFDYVWEVLTLAIEKEVVKKSGAWYSMGDTRLGQGENNVLDLLREDVGMLETIEKLVKNEN
jgi:recombination protein RecA